MGMFDYVAFAADCPKCGAPVTDWQTKSTDCLLETVTPAEAGNWYSSCDNCGLWIEYTGKPPTGRFRAIRRTHRHDRETREEVDKTEVSVLIRRTRQPEWKEAPCDAGQ